MSPPLLNLAVPDVVKYYEHIPQVSGCYVSAETLVYDILGTSALPEKEELSIHGAGSMSVFN